MKMSAESEQKLRELLRKKYIIQRMKEINLKRSKELFEAIFEICERGGAITNVGPEYYNSRLDLSDEAMEFVITCIICNIADSINEIVYSNTLPDDEADNKIYEEIESILRYIMMGIVGFSEKNLKMVFFKPVGVPPDAETEARIEKKIKEVRFLIHIGLIKCCKNYDPKDKETQLYISKIRECKDLFLKTQKTESKVPMMNSKQKYKVPVIDLTSEESRRIKNEILEKYKVKEFPAYLQKRLLEDYPNRKFAFLKDRSWNELSPNEKLVFKQNNP